MKIQTLFETDDADSAASHVVQFVGDLIKAVQGAEYFFKLRGPHDGMLYRGMKDRDKLEVRIATTRTDRKPRDSAPFLHNLLDARMVKDFGVPFRSAAMFATSDYGIASEYGDVNIVLPLGEFKFCWSALADDAIIYFGDRQFLNYVKKNSVDPTLTREVEDAIKNPVTLNTASRLWTEEDGPKRNWYINWFNGVYDEAEYQTTDMDAALESGHEIMVACKQYAYLPSTPLGSEMMAAFRTHLNDPTFMSGQKFARAADVINELAKRIHG